MDIKNLVLNFLAFLGVIYLITVFVLGTALVLHFYLNRERGDRSDKTRAK